MNYDLNHIGFYENLVDTHIDGRGIQYIFGFDNLYGALLLKTTYSRGWEKDLWELAVIIFMDDDYSYWNIAYDTEITDDVLGYLTDKDVIENLNKIKNLT